MIRRWINKFIAGKVNKAIDAHDFRQTLVRRINAEINIPGVSEEQEAELIDLLIKILIQVIKAKLISKFI